jgi:hypothetical protein
MNNQLGGYINTSKMSKIIVKLSTEYNQTPQNKIDINNSITNTGHGSIFLGSSARLENGDKNIRILIGAHYSSHGKLKIGVFGGGCERGELTIDTIIRETIEEIFNIIPNEIIIENIRGFLNTNTDYYFIVPTSSRRAYSYIFDVSVLGDFIKIMIDNNPNLQIPTINNTMSNLSTYLISNAQFTDESSFDGINNPSSLTYLFSMFGFRNNPTIDLIKFIQERKVGRKYRDEHKQIGLNEIRYLSFASLDKILASISSKNYNMFNFTNNKRESLDFQDLFLKLLTTSLNDILKLL